MLTPVKSPGNVPMTTPEAARPARDRPRALMQHMDEIRVRLVHCLIWVSVLSVGAYFFTDHVIHWLANMAGPLVYVRPAEAFMVKLKLSLVMGVFVSTPVILFHLWRYIGIALTIKERKIVFGALPFSYLLFLAGAALSWFVIAPASLHYLVSFGSEDLRPLISVEAVFNFVSSLTLVLGLIFQLPLVLAALSWWGIIDATFLAKYRKHAALIIIIVAAIVTPSPDLISPLLLALPTYALFEFSILLARLCAPERRA